jgi:hypothetical protein
MRVKNRRALMLEDCVSGLPCNNVARLINSFFWEGTTAGLSGVFIASNSNYQQVCTTFDFLLSIVCVTHIRPL